MKHLAGMVLALLAFAVATVLLIYNVKELAHAPLLLAAIVGFYLLAFAAAFPVQLAAARAELTAWYQAYKAGSGGGAV
jgi:hypothetical protein